MSWTSAGASGADRSTSPISAAKLGVTGQTVMVMGHYLPDVLGVLVD
jgi:hypothetical protein